MAFSQYITLLPNRDAPATASLFGETPPPLQLPSTPEAADQWMQLQAAYSKAENLVHPDIHFSYPVVTKKPGTPPSVSIILRNGGNLSNSFLMATYMTGCNSSALK
jgi:DNA polymerase-3 subunit delta'